MLTLFLFGFVATEVGACVTCRSHRVACRLTCRNHRVASLHVPLSICEVWAVIGVQQPWGWGSMDPDFDVEAALLGPEEDGAGSTLACVCAC